MPVLPALPLAPAVAPIVTLEEDTYTETSVGQGDITRVTRDAPGADLDPSLPHYTVQRYGHADKKIVLTFDDGPDRRYTPQILDILSAYHAPAAFFVTGVSVSAAPDLLQRSYREGHEIGNHTFTHPWLLSLPGWFETAELSSNQRLIQSALGVNTVLFRVPYSDNTEYTTTELVEPLALSGRLGYYHVGAQMDPKDWQRPGVDQIIATTLEEAHAGGGGILLLHDGGGDRSQTVATLPRLIGRSDQLRRPADRRRHHHRPGRRHGHLPRRHRQTRPSLRQPPGGGSGGQRQGGQPRGGHRQSPGP